MLWKKAGAAVLACIGGGLVLGIGGRLVMLLIALAADITPGFSLGGTAEVLATGFIIGIPAGLFFIAVRKHIRVPGLWKGGLFGGILFLILVLIPPPAARSAVAGVGHRFLPLTISLFGPLFVTYGIVVEAIMQRYSRV